MLNRQIASTQTLRMVELHTNDVFCTPLEARFDRLTRLARASLGVAVASITARAGQRLWFKSVIGWDVRELAISESLSERALATAEVVIIEDTQQDASTAKHPLVAKRPGFRFYAGQSLVDYKGMPVGTFDLYDLRPRTLSANDLQMFQDLVQLARKELLTTDLRDAQVQLLTKLDLARREALMDPLTATWNRRASDQLLEHAIKAADNEGGALAVCVVDIDKFKQINDTYGHDIGDAALRKVARTLVSGVRDGDAVCRIGGDEFLVIMERVGPHEGEDIAARIRRQVSQATLRVRNENIKVGITVGAALRAPGERLTPADLVQAADRNLYRAKQARTAVGAAAPCP